MITKEITLYKFDELSKESKKRVIERESRRVMEIESESISMDYRQTLEAFEGFVDIKMRKWSVDSTAFEFSYRSNNEEIYVNELTGEPMCETEVTGKLLFRYVNNNWIDRIIKRKYIKYLRGKARHYNLIKEENSCFLTGMYCDAAIADVICHYYRNWAKYPEKYSLDDLVLDCLDAFFESWKKSLEWVESEECIKNFIEQEDDLYFENGNIF